MDPPAAVGLSTAIVQILREYGRSLPIDFLARILKLDESEILGELDSLEKRGVIKRERERGQDYVGLSISRGISKAKTT